VFVEPFNSLVDSANDGDPRKLFPDFCAQASFVECSIPCGELSIVDLTICILSLKAFDEVSVTKPIGQIETDGCAANERPVQVKDYGLRILR
jgi:hypothetical protein